MQNAKKMDLLRGTLDMLILKTVALAPIHGYGISQRLRQMSRDVLDVRQGSLYPALHRLEKQGLVSLDARDLVVAAGEQERLFRSRGLCGWISVNPRQCRSKRRASGHSFVKTCC